MLVLAFVAGIVAMISPAAAVVPSLLVVVLGFDSVAVRLSGPDRNAKRHDTK
jgi:hypothetical protein